MHPEKKQMDEEIYRIQVEKKNLSSKLSIKVPQKIINKKRCIERRIFKKINKLQLRVTSTRKRGLKILLKMDLTCKWSCNHDSYYKKARIT